MSELFLFPSTEELLSESDRGCVIVGAAILEKTLTRIIQSEFKKNGLSNRYVVKAFDGNGPLGTLSSRIQIARGFGLISDDVFRDLMMVRKLRNEFAHSDSHCSFDDKLVRTQVDSLVFSKPARSEMLGMPNYVALLDKGEKALAVFYKCLFCLAVKDIEVNIVLSWAARKGV